MSDGRRATAVSTVAVPVPNHSFQLPVVPQNANPNDEDFINLFLRTPPDNQPPGWTYTYESGAPAVKGWGVARPGVGFYGANNPAPAPFDQDQFGIINLDVSGKTIATADSGLLGSLAAGQTHSLSVAVGARNNANWRNIRYSIGLVDGNGTELGGFSSVTMDPGDSATNIVDLHYSLNVSAAASASIGKPYFVRIRAANMGVGGSIDFVQANLDNVRLQLTNSSPVAVVDVPGISNLWLAGMPTGTMADIQDVAPEHSPKLVDGIPLVAGKALHFSALGMVTHKPDLPFMPPDGDQTFIYTKLAEHGKAALTNRMNSLIGVFLDESQPDATAAPTGLDFTGNFEFGTLAPALRQPFFIGDGMTSAGILQAFIVPAGATRLYLGTHDGYDWKNNEGTFRVTISVVPEPIGASPAVIGVLATVVLTRRWRCANHRKSGER